MGMNGSDRMPVRAMAKLPTAGISENKTASLVPTERGSCAVDRGPTMNERDCFMGLLQPRLPVLLRGVSCALGVGLAHRGDAGPVERVLRSRSGLGVGDPDGVPGRFEGAGVLG